VAKDQSCHISGPGKGVAKKKKSAFMMCCVAGQAILEPLDSEAGGIKTLRYVGNYSPYGTAT